MIEIWKPIPGWETYYSVSNLGRIKRDAGSPRCTTDRIIKPLLSSYKYLVFSPSKKGVKQIPVCIHRVVLEAFVGFAPSSKHQGNHINGIKTDNRLENLEWVTRSQNIKHAYDNGLHKRYVGSKASSAKLNENQVFQILEKIAAREYRKTIAKEFNISTKMIDEIVAGNHWSHVPRPDMSKKRIGRHVLTADNVREIRGLLGTMSCREIGKKYGVTGATIQHIKSGFTWSNV